MQKPIRVLIVDDSRLMQRLFTDMLASDPGIAVIGTASDPFEAREKIKALQPDVLTLDIEMPRMDGLTFLEKIMTLRPMPVVMVSTLTERGADATLQALESGAVDYMTKPVIEDAQALEAARTELIAKVKAAARARLGVSAARRQAPPRPVLTFSGRSQCEIIALGASTGGVEVLRDILTVLPANLPPIVIAQHMPDRFRDNNSRGGAWCRQHPRWRRSGPRPSGTAAQM